MPPFSWAAGFARPDTKALSEIRSAISQAFQKCFSRDFARVSFFEALDWQLHRIQIPGWLDFLPISEARYRWQVLIPEAPSVLQRLGWVMDFAGSELQRRDRAGRLIGLLGLGLMGFRLSSSGSGSVTGRPSLPGRVGSSTAVMTPLVLQGWTFLPRHWMLTTTSMACVQCCKWAFAPRTVLPWRVGTRVGSSMPMAISLTTIRGGTACAAVLSHRGYICCGAASVPSICAPPCDRQLTDVRRDCFFREFLSNRRLPWPSTSATFMTIWCRRLPCSFDRSLLCSF